MKSIWTIAVASATLALSGLAPAAPQNLTGGHSSTNMHMTWSANGEADIAGYSTRKKKV